MEQNRGLIVVIIPTVGLGIEQAQRAKQILAQANLAKVKEAYDKALKNYFELTKDIS
jgi:hypothetical protein